MSGSSLVCRKVWLKRCNRISPNHYTKDNKKHIKNNTRVKTEGAESVAANAGDCGGTIKRVAQREFTPERGEQGLILC